MSSSHHEKNSDDHDRDEEAQLPLYEPATDDEAASPLYNASRDVSKPQLIDATASPAEVREFITQLLTATRGCTEEHAAGIAAKWALGTGHELLNTYPPQMYREIFGNEDGWVTYREVILLKYETSHPEKNQRTKGCIALAISVSLAVAIYFLIRLAVDAKLVLVTTLLVILGLFDGVVMITALIALLPKTSALDLVEGKLEDKFFKASQTGSST